MRSLPKEITIFYLENGGIRSDPSWSKIINFDDGRPAPFTVFSSESGASGKYKRPFQMQ